MADDVSGLWLRDLGGLATQPHLFIWESGLGGPPYLVAVSKTGETETRGTVCKFRFPISTGLPTP